MTTSHGPIAPAERVHYRTCPLCEATCGLRITVRGERVQRIEGDKRDVFSHGFICPKGASLKAFHEDSDRLRAPLIRRGDDPARAEYEEVSWEEAFAEAHRLLTGVIERHGRLALGAYLGNPNTHHLAGLLYGRPLLKALGTPNVFSASTVDQMPKEVASGFMFGAPTAFAVPDLDRTDFLLMLGANPWESNGSLCTAPDFPGRLKNIQERGGRFVVVDPRRTRTAQHADEHIKVRPGTDAFLLLAMVHVLFAEDLVNPGGAAEWVTGIERVRELVQPFSPGAASSLTTVPAETIVRLARELAGTPRAVVYGRIGTHTVEFGTLTAWAVDLLNTLSGHLDAPGGAMWPLPAHKAARAPGPGRGFVTGRRHSRVKGYPEVAGEFPCATLADEILEPGEGQIRGFITVAGNPVLSTPDGARLARALGELECMISVDPYRNETTRFAHVILPPPSPLTTSHYDLAFYGIAVRNVANWSAPVFPASGPREEDILARLALIAAGQPPDADPAHIHRLVEHGALQRCQRETPELAGRSIEELSALLEAESPVDRVVEVLVRGGAYGDLFGARPGGLTFARLQAEEHGIDLGPLTTRLPGVLQTPSGRVELAPEPICEEIKRLQARLGEPGPAGLLLVGRRDLRSNNSWMHNLTLLAKGPERCSLLIHPEDAGACGIDSGGEAVVRSDIGELVVRVEVTQDIMPGTVSLPHGFGHDAQGARLGVAAERPGVNSNLLTDPSRLDPLSGTAVLNGIPVQVSPA